MARPPTLKRGWGFSPYAVVPEGPGRGYTWPPVQQVPPRGFPLLVTRPTLFPAHPHRPDRRCVASGGRHLEIGMRRPGLFVHTSGRPPDGQQQQQLLLLLDTTRYYY